MSGGEIERPKVQAGTYFYLVDMEDPSLNGRKLLCKETGVAAAEDGSEQLEFAVFHNDDGEKFIVPFCNCRPVDPIRTKPRYDVGLIRRACAEGDPDAIVELSLAIERDLWSADGLHGTRRFHVGGTADQRNFVYQMIRACHEADRAPPIELVRVLQLILEQDRAPRAGAQKAWRTVAEKYLQDHPAASNREIAKAVGVAHTTIGRWRCERA